jgi:hypothetical protein
MADDALRRRALMVMGDRARVTSAELLGALMPGWSRQYHGEDGRPSPQKAGYALAQALGVSPLERVMTESGYRSFYYRQQFEDWPQSPEPASPAPPAIAAPPGTMSDGIPRCAECGAGKPSDDEPCWRCSAA